MCKSFGYPELPPVGRGKPRPNPFSERGRIATDIYRNVTRRSGDHPHKFSLCMRWQLIVKSPQNTFNRYRMIFLDKIQGSADHLLECSPAEGFEKFTAVVRKNYGLEKNDVGNGERGRLHQKCFSENGLKR